MIYNVVFVSDVQQSDSVICCSFTQLWQLCDPMDCSTSGFLVSQSLFKLMSIESMMPSNNLMLCRPLLFLPPILPSIRVFSNESALCIRKPKYWSFSISLSNEYSGLITFRIDCFDLAVHGTLRSLLQLHSLKAVLQRSAEMATHSSILAWRIPRAECGGLQSMGSQRVGHD